MKLDEAQTHEASHVMHGLLAELWGGDAVCTV
jgi:hypothetical protein